MAFAFGFGIFLALMAVLVFFVLRFAVREAREGRRQATGPSDEPAAPTLEDHTDEG
jgi:hypothetical protein